jgi:hypothetical protein
MKKVLEKLNIYKNSQNAIKIKKSPISFKKSAMRISGKMHYL